RPRSERRSAGRRQVERCRPGIGEARLDRQSNPGRERAVGDVAGDRVGVGRAGGGQGAVAVIEQRRDAVHRGARRAVRAARQLASGPATSFAASALDQAWRLPAREAPNRNLRRLSIAPSVAGARLYTWPAKLATGFRERRAPPHSREPGTRSDLLAGNRDSAGACPLVAFVFNSIAAP